ncbi:MAG TPA: ParB N-terminal domain-containing protein [Acetobacteraceae bacterium]|nr:ParB N-terminal domain-containing protein [Acetobacteraceae bacterium]
MSKAPAPKTKNSAPPPGLVYIPLDQIEPDINQPRRMNTLQRETAARFDEFFGNEKSDAKADPDIDRNLAQKKQEKDDTADAGEEEGSLTDSIIAQGVIQPVIVERVGEERYKLIAGERRWTAAVRARARIKRKEPGPSPRADYDYSRIPAVVIDPGEASRRLEMQLVENIQRFGMSVEDIGRALRTLQTDKKYSMQELAYRIGKSTGFIQNALMASSPEGQDLATRLRTQDWHIIRRVLALRKDRQKAFDEIIRRVTKEGERFTRALYFEAVEKYDASLKADEHERMRKDDATSSPAPPPEAGEPRENTPDQNGKTGQPAVASQPSSPSPLKQRTEQRIEDPEERLYRTRAASYTAMVEHEDGPAVLLLREKYQRRLEAPARAELVEFYFKLRRDEADAFAGLMRFIHEDGARGFKPGEQDAGLPAEEIVGRLKSLVWKVRNG